jgi:rod shape-determining protein MreD
LPALKYIVPLSSIVLLTLIAALPWGLPSEDRFFLPFLPVVAIHYWGLRRPELVPEWFVFMAGLCLDTLTHGPLGYWALVYLAAYASGVLSQPFGNNSLMARTGIFVISLIAVAFTAWAAASLYFIEFADWKAFARGAGLAGFAAIVIVPLLYVLDGRKTAPGNASLMRRT